MEVVLTNTALTKNMNFSYKIENLHKICFLKFKKRIFSNSFIIQPLIAD